MTAPAYAIALSAADPDMPFRSLGDLAREIAGRWPRDQRLLLKPCVLTRDGDPGRPCVAVYFDSRWAALYAFMPDPTRKGAVGMVDRLEAAVRGVVEGAAA